MKQQKNLLEKTLNSTHHKWVLYDHEPNQATLVELLCSKLPGIEKSSWPTRLALGGVSLNGKIIKEDTPLTPPCWIEYFEPHYPPEKISQHFPPFCSDWIIFQDDHLIAAFKPPGLPTLANRDQQEFSLKNYLEKFLGNKIHFPSRLDTATSGIVLGSLNPQSHDPVQKLFENRLIKKHYLLEVEKAVNWRRKEVTLPIGRSPLHPVLRKIDHEGGAEASTTLLSFEHNKKFLLAIPLTGRTHQIRVHTNEIAGPIVGDTFYGGKPAKDLHLLSYKLEFVHPITNLLLSLSVPEPLLPEWVPKEVELPEFI